MASAKKILIVSLAFPPDPSVGALRPASFAKYLPLYGWTPYTLTWDIRYLKKIDTGLKKGFGAYGHVIRTAAFPHPKGLYQYLKGRFSNGRNLEKKEMNFDSKSPTVPKKNFMKKLLITLFQTPDEYWGWIPFALAKGIQVVRQEKIPILYSTGPPWTSHLVGFFLKLVTGCYWIVDFRDPWSRNHLTSPELISTLSRVVGRTLEKLVLQKADQLLCVTEELAEDFQQQYPSLLKRRPIVIPNGYDQDEFDRVMKGKRSDHRFTITYSGDFYGERNPYPFLRAISELIHERKVTPEDLSIRFVGSYEIGDSKGLQEEIIRLGLKDVVEMTGRLPREEALRYVVDSDALLLIQMGTKLQIPVKYYEYLATGKPMLVLTDEGATKRSVLKDRSGIINHPENILEIKESIQSLYNNWKKKYMITSSSSHWRIYERKRLTGEFAKVIDQTFIPSFLGETK